ncbi:heavy-metal-associated domain-containing protein [Candidatus Woesearchaeota archaeon]|nr:heavy-metal-associated domain-containing protein [Candidatus Woesearchaeota archaeon]
MKEVTFYVEGMSCTGCANSITAALGTKEGIIKAKVDFDSHKATVIYNEKRVNEAAIATALKEMGYGFRRKASVNK